MIRKKNHVFEVSAGKLFTESEKCFRSFSASLLCEPKSWLPLKQEFKHQKN